MRTVCCAGWLVVCAFAASPTAAQEEPLHVALDRRIAAQFEGREPAPLADDVTFLRRVWLDLAGRIPSAEDTRAFLADPSPDKRTQTIDRLLAAPTYRQRLREWLHALLMERRGDHPEWQKFLQTCAERNLPWNEIAAALLDPSDADEATRGAAFFYAKRLEAYGQNPTDFPGLTRDVGRLLLGIDLQCCQCHNHLFIDDYKQREFQGLFAVYKNLSLRTDVKFPAVVEKASQPRLEFVSVFDATPRETGPHIPFGKDLDWLEQPPSDPQVKGPVYRVLPALARDLPSPDNPLFAKNMANRLWFAMMGEGLVMPLDQFHAGNPPSHPEVLELLAQSFAAHGYDIPWFLRELALSDCYQRAGQWAEGPLPSRRSYLVANEKRLSPEQLLWSVLQATGNLTRLTGGEGATPKELEDLQNRFLKAFANEPREPEVEFNATVAGASFLSNDERMLNLLQPQGGNLTARLLATTDETALQDELFLSVFTRLPAADERAAVSSFLSARSDRREAALGQVIWSLVAATEFCVNH